MSNIRKFNEFDNNDKFKNIEPVNEFLGGIIKDFFKNAKNRMSIGISKKIGGAKEVDKAIEEYKAKLQPFLDQELDGQKKIIEMKNGMSEGEDETELNNLKKAIEAEQRKIDKQKDASKRTFMLKIDKIKSDTDDKNIKYYANLKRAELAEDILANKLQKLSDLGGEEMDDDDYFVKMISDIKKSGEHATNFTKKIFGKLNKALGDDDSNGDKPTFDIEEARNNVNYKWKDSPYWKSELKSGTELTFWSGSIYKKEGDEYKGTLAKVREDQDIEDPENNIAITTSGNKKGFYISKGKIISLKSDKSEVESNDESNDKEEVEI